MTDVLKVIAAARLLPVITIDDAAAAVPLAAALKRGGLGCAEITLRTPAARDALAALAADPDLVTGAGTVLTPEQAARALDAGAQFIVSPGLSLPLVRYCQQAGVPVFPGVATATEVMTALDAGLEVVKFFPAQQSGGAAALKALHAPLPMMKFIPTGGITAANLPDYLAVPAVLAAGGSWMAAPPLLRAGDFGEITRLTAAAVALAAGAQG